MELQEKFKERVVWAAGSVYKTHKGEKVADEVDIDYLAKECTKLCLEEQMKLIKSLLHKGNKEIWHEILNIEQQLKSLE